MKRLQKVKTDLERNGIGWVSGKDFGWGEDSLILEGVDCKILCYVLEVKGKLELSYYDLFEKGEYSPIFNSKNKETTTSHRGNSTSVKGMLKDIDLM